MAGRLVSKGCIEKYVVILEWGPVLGRMGILDRKNLQRQRLRDMKEHVRFEDLQANQHGFSIHLRVKLEMTLEKESRPDKAKGSDAFIHFCRPWIREEHYRLFIECMF